jgi:hypothetical protein
MKNTDQNTNLDIENFIDTERLSHEELLNPNQNSNQNPNQNSNQNPNQNSVQNPVQNINSNQINKFEIYQEDIYFTKAQTNNTFFTKVCFMSKQVLNYISSFFYQQKNDIYNKFLSITLHIFIMVVFEIYFYFNYVIEMERAAFIDKINAYFSYLYNSDTSPYSNKNIFYQIINLNYTENQLNNVYNEYNEALNEQNELYNKLLTQACYIAGFIGLVLVVLFLNALYNKNVIKWKWIIVENILMLAFLGLFEYVFFVNIIMHYNPISDAEIKYIIVNNFVNYFNQTS